MKKLILLPLLLLFGITCRAQETKVLICLGKSSYAYHSHHCYGLDRCKASIRKVTITEAIKMNRDKACEFCYGKRSKPSYSSGSQSSSTQCRAITQRGTRCSRNSRSGGYCWQHGG